MRAFTAGASLALLATAMVSCGDGDTRGPAAAQAGVAPAAETPATGSGAAARGGRAPRTVILAATDVATVANSTIEEGIPITGALRPIQTVAVRARLEGDIEGVYAREGERVRAGQLLARFEASEQASEAQSAVADRVAAEGELATAQWNFEQTRELYRAGAVAERDLRAAEQAVTTARARVAAAQARVRTTGSEVRETRVLAPATAMVERRLVEPGEHVARGTELFTLVRSETLELTAAVPERRASSIAPGQRVRFDAAGRRFEGRVARVSPTIDPASRSVTVYVQVPNATGNLRGGTFATGVVVARLIEGALVVPIAAIRQTAAREPFVYRIAAGTVEQVSVALGITNEDAGIAEVLSGLTSGDRVIVGNVSGIGRGMRVQVIGGDRPRAQTGPGAGSSTGTNPSPAAAGSSAGAARTLSR
jgi:membrane fusion protein (multidrug efflux system)